MVLPHPYREYGVHFISFLAALSLCFPRRVSSETSHPVVTSPSQEGKQEGSLYPVFTLTRFDSMLESALLISIIGLAGSHRRVHEVLSGRPVIQAKPQAGAMIRRKQLSCQGAERVIPAKCGGEVSSPNMSVSHLVGDMAHAHSRKLVM